VPGGQLQTNAILGVLPKTKKIAPLVQLSKDVQPVIVLMRVTLALQVRMGADVASQSAAPVTVARIGQRANSAMGTTGHATPEMPPAVNPA